MVQPNSFSSPQKIYPDLSSLRENAREDNSATLCERVGYVVAPLFQGMAVVGAITSLIVMAAIAPMIGLAGMVASIALGALGLSVNYFCPETPNVYGGRGAPFLAPPPPFVPGQPIGIPNNGSNCWLNAGMQIILNSPDLLAKVRSRNLAPFNQFFDAYQNARQNQKISLEKTNAGSIRTFLSQTSDDIHVGGQEDAAVLFQSLFRGPIDPGAPASNGNQLYAFNFSIDGREGHRQRYEPCIGLELNSNRGVSFENLMNQFFNYQTDIGQNVRLQFPTAPEGLLIQMRRFYIEQSTSSTSATVSFDQRRNNSSVAVPLQLTLDGSRSADGGAQHYTCDGFIVHSGGASVNDGHYVAYTKDAQGRWWSCNDSRVTQVSSERIPALMAEGYFYHFRRT